MGGEGAISVGSWTLNITFLFIQKNVLLIIFLPFLFLGGRGFGRGYSGKPKTPITIVRGEKTFLKPNSVGLWKFQKKKKDTTQKREWFRSFYLKKGMFYFLQLFPKLFLKKKRGKELAGEKKRKIGKNFLFFSKVLKKKRN